VVFYVLAFGGVALISGILGFLIGRHERKEKSRLDFDIDVVGSTNFFKSLPFYVAMITMITSLAAALVLEGYFDIQDGSFLFSEKTYIAVAKEFFFASLIALFIIMTVEVTSKQEQTDFLKRSSKVARRDVIEAVYETRLGRKIFQEVEESIFRSVFVREHHVRSMVLTSIGDGKDHVMLKAKQKYQLRNVSDRRQSSRQNIHVPVTTNPHSASSGVKSISAVLLEGEFELAPEYDELGGGNVSLEKVEGYAKKSDDGAEKIYEFPSIIVGAGSLIEVEIEFEIAKERSDNELLTFLSPTLYASRCPRRGHG